MKRLGIVALINFNDWDSSTYTETGGINSVIRNLIPYLDADKIVLYGYTYDKKNLFKEKKVTSQISVFPILYTTPTPMLPKRFLGFFFGWRLNKYLKQHSIDMVYCHSEEVGYWLTFGAVPYIYHLHTFVNALEVSGGKLSKVKLFKAFWEQIRTRLIMKSFKIVAVNKDIVEMGEALIGKTRIVEFPNYVDMKAFTYRESNALKERLGVADKKVALYIGRITQIKGMELYVDCIQKLNESDNDAWIGVVVGTGDYEATLKDYIGSKGMDEHFVFTGSINDSIELSGYYSIADVFLITSFSESVPLTLLESLACGTPVVSTKVGIAKDVLNGSNGFVVDSRNAEEFAKKVLLAVPLKSEQNLLSNSYYYSVEYASGLLNKEVETVSNRNGNAGR